MEERRKAPRGRTYLAGRIVFNHKTSTTDCIVRNWSSEGARIVFSDLSAIPDAFEFLVPGRGERHEAQVVWRHASEAGVRFGA